VGLSIGGADRVLVPQGFAVDGAHRVGARRGRAELLMAVAQQWLATGHDEFDLAWKSEVKAGLRGPAARRVSATPLLATCVRFALKAKNCVLRSPTLYPLVDHVSDIHTSS
jgi:hypothetical protein